MSDREHRIYRLVDGELTPQEQRKLLFECEEQQCWRQVALTYVEAQTLGLELKRLLPESSADAQASGGRSREAAKRHAPARWHAWSLAASVVMALVIGYALGWWVDGPANMRPESTRFADQPPSTSATVADAALGSMQFTIPDPRTNELKQIDLPIVRASALGPNWAAQLPRAVSDDFIVEMRGHGLNVTEQRTFVPVKTASGERVLIPVDYVNLEQCFY